MNQVDLPIVELATDLDTALRTLHTIGRSAILCASAGSFLLFTARNIAVSRSRGAALLSDMTSGTTISAPKTLPADTSVTLPNFGKATHVLTSPVLRTAFVAVKNSKSYVVGPPDYYCDRNSRHEFPPPYVTEGQDCPYGDGKIVSSR